MWGAAAMPALCQARASSSAQGSFPFPISGSGSVLVFQIYFFPAGSCVLVMKIGITTI